MLVLLNYFYPLVNFWQHLLENPECLSERIMAYHPLKRETFFILKKTFKDINDKLDLAAVYYVLNRNSFSGLTFDCGITGPKRRLSFSKKNIRNINYFRANNLTVDFADWKQTVNKHDNKFLYLDPPYDINRGLYGYKGEMHKNFDHECLAEYLNNRDGWILSYNNIPKIRKMYDNKKYKILTPNWNYSIRKTKISNEILILNT